MTYLQPNLSSFLGICIIIGGCGILISAIVMPFMIFFISRRFDPLFGNKVMALCSPRIGFSRCRRSSWYSAIMLSPQWYRNRPRIYAMFKGHSLWQHASKFERFLACLYIIPGSIGLPAGAILSLNHLIICLRGLPH